MGDGVAGMSRGVEGWKAGECSGGAEERGGVRVRGEMAGVLRSEAGLDSADILIVNGECYAGGYVI